MKAVRPIFFAAAVAAIATGPIRDAGVAFFQAGYPQDPVKRAALAKCQAVNPAFVRFSEDERADCYLRLHAG